MRLNKNQALTELVARFESDQLSGNTSALCEQEYQDLIYYYDCLRQYDQILHVLDLAIEARPYTVEYYLKKADFLMAIHQPKQALEVLDYAAALAPGNFESLILRIEILANLGELELAWLFLKELPKPTGKAQEADFLTAKACWFEFNLDFEQMYELLKLALKLMPAHQMALEKLGLAVEVTKKHQESIDLHRQIIDKKPYAYQAWFNLGQALVYLGHYQEAVEAYEYAFIIDPYFEMAYREYIDLCFELKHYDNILQCYEDLQNYFPLDTDDLLRIGQCYQYTGQQNKARQSFDQAARMDAFNDEVYFHIGECLSIEEDWIGALHYYNKAIALENKREEYYASRGEAFFMMDNLQQAENDFIKATSLCPDATDLWLQYCSFLMQVGQAARALEILDQQPPNEDTQLEYCRVACLFLLGKRKEAIYWLIEVLSEDFDGHNLLFELIPDIESDPDVCAQITAYYHHRY